MAPLIGDTEVNREQAEMWNGPSGQAWVEGRALLDHMYQPVAEAILAKAPPVVGARILDVGCGAGAVTLAYARRLGAAGACVGIDISASMIETARARGANEGLNVRFIQADAQIHTFERASFDLFVSRFGVMFFDDPVGAFTNLRHAARANAKVCFAVWRGPEDNEFFTTPERVAAPFLPDPPAREPNAPGRFAFADSNRVARILGESGWDGIDIRPADISCAFPTSDLQYCLTRLGRIGHALPQLDEQTRARLIEAALPTFAPYVIGQHVHFTAACWIVEAHAPSFA